MSLHKIQQTRQAFSGCTRYKRNSSRLLFDMLVSIAYEIDALLPSISSYDIHLVEYDDRRSIDHMAPLLGQIAVMARCRIDDTQFDIGILSTAIERVRARVQLPCQDRSDRDELEWSIMSTVQWRARYPRVRSHHW